MSRKQWRCFFCDELFTDRREAAQHFGVFDACEADQVACKLMAHQKHVIDYIRKLEREVRQYMAENIPVVRAMYAVEFLSDQKAKDAEERGYNKGVHDMMARGMCPEPQKHENRK